MCKKINGKNRQITIHKLEDILYVNCNRRSDTWVLELLKDSIDYKRPWEGKKLVCVPEGHRPETGEFITFLCFPKKYTLKECESIFFECEKALADYAFAYLLRVGRRDSYIVREDSPLPRGYYVGDETRGSYSTFAEAAKAGYEMGIF